MPWISLNLTNWRVNSELYMEGFPPVARPWSFTDEKYETHHSLCCFSALSCYLLHVGDINLCSTLPLKRVLHPNLQRGQLTPMIIRSHPSPSIHKMLWHINTFPSRIFPCIGRHRGWFQSGRGARCIYFSVQLLLLSSVITEKWFAKISPSSAGKKSKCWSLKNQSNSNENVL